MTAMKTTIKSSLIASAIALLPLGSHAAGLGAINVFSGLGQPLRAEIELHASAEELRSLNAAVASPEAFRRANLQYSAAMTALRLAVESRGNRAVVKVTSDRPLNEPFVDLLVELNWAAGSLVREYTFLLDPVSAQPAPAVAAVRPAAGNGAPAPARSNAPVAARPSSSGSETYTVQRGDTLRRVAEATRAPDVTLEQMLVALFRNNPDAFDDANVNRLRAGSVLRVPDAATARAIEPGAAKREVQTQSADFDAYRRKLAKAVASQPAAERAPSRGDAGAIVPKVTERTSAPSGDQVKVSGGAEKAAAGADARLAKLQALEEELAARSKALDEANSRLAALEENLRQMQQLLELRNQNLAQLQQQATPAAAAPAVAESKPAPAEPAAPKTEAAPQASEPVKVEAPKPAPPKPEAEKPAAPQEPAPQPSFVEGLLQEPIALGGGGIVALLLAYLGLKVRQRRQNAAEAAAGGAVSQFPIESNSVFGKTGGQSVNTGESSVLHTDFSQSGLSNIDTDEGVDPVAEADVYMAYGRDAQAEEILLDALKTDSSRAAIYLKLLEIYAQRNNLKAFEATATDLYSRTGGEGSDWEKAAEMGHRLDPNNPLYGAGAARRSGVGDAGLAAAAALGAMSAASAAEPRMPETVDVRPEANLPVEEAANVELEALPQVDDNVLDFDLDVGLGLSADGAGVSPPVAASPVETPLPEVTGEAFEIDLDVGGAAAPELPAETMEAEAPGEAQLNETVIGEGLDFAAADQGLEFDLGSIGEPEPAAESAQEFSLDSTVVGAEPEASSQAVNAEPESDLEKTTFDSSLLDFDFNLDDSALKDEAVAPAAALDLSGIDLELAAPGAVGGGLDVGLPAAAAASAGGAEPAPEVIEEVNTKLELARAYEEMGDAEGARELLDEVLREGSTEQREAATRLLERLG